jgi:hypothetical protein
MLPQELTMAGRLPVNGRILFFKKIPGINNEAADDFRGTPGFESIGEHLETGMEKSERLYWPFSVSISNNQLAVADTGNHRIAFYKL